ncbi:MAG: hypothetical protein H6631_03115 [Anaerolineaceae bacterium]|nr:hypothetical protein [Anaerolineaceae bacterium]MCB9099685.1 hypothetical protein [Anaerolineales bacterium]
MLILSVYFHNPLLFYRGNINLPPYTFQRKIRVIRAIEPDDGSFENRSCLVIRCIYALAYQPVA